MLDTSFVAPKKEATDYTPLPDDMYQVELLDVSSKQTETFDSKKARASDSTLEPQMETVLDFTFTVLEETEIEGKSVRGRNIYMNYVPAYLYIGKKGKNDLYKIVEALQAANITPEQEAYGITGETLNGLIGKQCRIITKQVTKGDKTYMNVENLLMSKVALEPLNAQEKLDAMPKPKDAEHEKRMEAAFEGEELVTEN